MQDDQPLTALERTLPPHLGGHFGNSNLDPATLDYLIARYEAKTMLDVGCGLGGMVDLARAKGIYAVGIDGDWTINHPFVAAHDYATGPYRGTDGLAQWIADVRMGVGFGLIWSVEFVEHVEEQYQGNYLDTFDAGRVLFLTAAPPGFPGWHHINCQPQEYWIELLSRYGWALDHEATAWVRTNGSHIFTQRQGLVFVKGDQ